MRTGQNYSYGVTHPAEYKLRRKDEMISTIRKTIQKRRAAALAVLVLLCLLTAGCGGRSAKQAGKDQSGSAQEQAGGDQSGGAQQQTGEDQSGGAQEQAGEAETRGPVRIGVLQIADSFPLYVAVEEGLFQKHGLDVEIIEFQSASDQSVAYEAGELDGMMTDMIVQSLINKSSAEDGMKTVAMAFGGDASEGRFIVASSPDSGISAPEQLAGSKIGISENTMMEYLVGRYLENLGVDLSSVEMVNIPKLTLRLDLLMEGSDIQAAILPDPLAIEAESRGCGTVIDDTKLGKNYSQSVVTLRKTLIEDGAGTLDAFRDAYNEAIEKINADPDACLELFYEKANVAEPLQGRYAVPSYTPDCVPTEEDVAKIEEFMVKKGLLDKPFSYEEMVEQ